MTAKTDEAQLPSPNGADEMPASLTRRKLLACGAKSMPAILTLQSGAALAKSSFQIQAAPSHVTDGLDRTLCVDESSVDPADASGLLWDLGNPPHMEINIIPGPAEKPFFLEDNKSSPVDPGDMCLRGGPFYWKPDAGPWQMTSVNRGFVASIGAVTSFALSGYTTENLL